MGRTRRCDSRCHHAKGTRCKCWCGGFFHGAAGAVNRQAVRDGVDGVLEEHGFKNGETKYLEQQDLPGMEDAEAA